MRNFAITFISLLFLAGCNKPDPAPSPDPKPDPEPTPTEKYFKASIYDVYVQGPNDTGFTIVIDTNMDEKDWSVEGGASWLTINKSSTEVVIVPATIEQDYTYPAPRTASISIKAGTVFNKTFSVVQEAWTRLSSVYEVKLSPAGETVELTVSHNCYSWTPGTDASWLSVRKKDTGTLVITSDARSTEDKQARTAIVRLQSDWQSTIFWNITVSDADSNLGNEDYNYGDRTDWD